MRVNQSVPLLSTKMTLSILKEHHCHGGVMTYYSHTSQSVNGEMAFAVFYPPQMNEGVRLPALTYLAGLTCTQETFMMKGGAQQFAAKHGIILVAPDTSPRGAGIASEDEAWDFGTGAGFYINATQDGWAKNYRMEDYVTGELQGILEKSLNVDMAKQGIFGHSMGGHGALTLGLKYPEIYKSISAFAPICAPIDCPWGEKAFLGYLGKDTEAWKRHDAVELVRTLDKSQHRLILIDQGLADEFLKEQLKPEQLEQVCKDVGFPLTMRYHEGYDHSYYFISTFMADHLAHHAKVICA
jgi:S-formylglutathione hydrolase